MSRGREEASSSSGRRFAVSPDASRLMARGAPVAAPRDALRGRTRRYLYRTAGEARPGAGAVSPSGSRCSSAKSSNKRAANSVCRRLSFPPRSRRAGGGRAEGARGEAVPGRCGTDGGAAAAAGSGRERAGRSGIAAGSPGAPGQRVLPAAGRD